MYEYPQALIHDVAAEFLGAFNVELFEDGALLQLAQRWWFITNDLRYIDGRHGADLHETTLLSDVCRTIKKRALMFVSQRRMEGVEVELPPAPTQPGWQLEALGVTDEPLVEGSSRTDVLAFLHAHAKHKEPVDRFTQQMMFGDDIDVADARYVFSLCHVHLRKTRRFSRELFDAFIELNDLVFEVLATYYGGQRPHIKRSHTHPQNHRQELYQ